LLVAATLSFTSGCTAADHGADQGTASDAVVVRDSAGVEMVTSHRAQWADGRGWQVDTSPITRLGDNEDDAMQHWEDVDHLIRRDDGSLLVALRGEIRWFSADGRYRASITRSGKGPGEFRSFGSLYRMPGDSLRATDDLGSKTAVFAPDGSLVRESTLDETQLRTLGNWIDHCGEQVLPDGSRLACQEDPSIAGLGSVRRSDSHADVPAGPYRPIHRLYVISPSFDRAWPLGVSAEAEGYGVTLDGRTELYRLWPYHAQSVTVAGGNPVRIAHAINPAYRIEIWTTDGRLTRVIERTTGRRPPTKQEIVDVIKAKRASSGMWRAGLVEAALEQIPTPDSLPALISIAMNDVGELMVMREGHLPSHTMSVYDVFDPKGQWLGELRIPGRVGVASFGEDYLLAVRQNEDGMMLVEVLPLRRGQSER